MKKNSLVIVVCAILLALTFVFGMIPAAFLLPTLFAVCAFGFGISFFASFSFGVVSLILFFANPLGMFYGTVGWYFTTYPWMPIVTRMFIGPIAHAAFLGLSKLTKNWGIKGQITSISLAAAFGSLLNTVFVGSFIFLIGSDWLPSEFANITVGFLAVNGAIEIAIAAVVIPPIVLAVKRAAPKLFVNLGLMEPTRLKAVASARKNDENVESTTDIKNDENADNNIAINNNNENDLKTSAEEKGEDGFNG